MLYFSANKLRTLEAQYDLAERKLQEYKQELGKTGTVFLGDPSNFQKMLAERESDADASFMSKFRTCFFIKWFLCVDVDYDSYSCLIKFFSTRIFVFIGKLLKNALT